MFLKPVLASFESFCILNLIHTFLIIMQIEFLFICFYFPFRVCCCKRATRKNGTTKGWSPVGFLFVVFFLFGSSLGLICKVTNVDILHSNLMCKMTNINILQGLNM